MPQLDQYVVTRRSGEMHGIALANQRDLSIDAVPPGTYGWTWADDRDPTTPPCQMVGLQDWQSPVIRIRQDPRAIHILAVSRPTEGSRIGCELGSDETLPCPNLTQTIVRLRRPVGDRRILLEQFADDAAAEQGLD